MMALLIFQPVFRITREAGFNLDNKLDKLKVGQHNPPLENE